jgi:hypothetical protein
MSDFKPQNAQQHFAQQRTSRAAEVVTAALDAQQKDSEGTRASNERFYNGLALYSGGTIALSVTYMGYLKTLGKPPGHPHWLVTAWTCLLVCVACSLFWTFVYGHYSFFFHEWQAADAHKDKHETDAEEYATMVRGARSVQTQAPVSQKDIDDFRSNRLAAAAIYEERAAKAKRRETLHLRLWTWLGRVARICFLVGLGFLLAFAIENL